ncbi:hypothetical protein [Flammeovirga aprica]|uniref:Uncharacterized protein n=1 Tax=Flammeovirga aprica JL-4 TaxID=694437 RepID=A0A7X9RZS0_9BACT|nr:hypothetical protein [Flammeovirga aprica]NME71760.1 hypothetical protein [Flammeovirga aprica JL-4]
MKKFFVLPLLLLLQNYAHAQSLLGYSLLQKTTPLEIIADSVSLNGISGTLECESIYANNKKSVRKIYQIKFMAYKYYFSEAEIQNMIQFLDKKYGLSLVEKGEYNGYCDYGYQHKGINYCFASERNYILFVMKDAEFYDKRRKTLLKQSLKKHSHTTKFRS